jgi:hypothetical protein
MLPPRGFGGAVWGMGRAHRRGADEAPRRRDTVGAVGLFGFGAGALLVADNLIQPALIGGTERLPFLLALTGILGDQGDDGERVGVVGMDDVAEIELSEPDPAVDRRRNGGITKPDASAFNRGLIGLHRGPELIHLRLLLIHRLLGNDAFWDIWGRSRPAR